MGPGPIWANRKWNWKNRDMMGSEENLRVLLERFKISLNFEIKNSPPEEPKFSKEDVWGLFGKHKFFITILNGQFKCELSVLPPGIGVYNLSETGRPGLVDNFAAHVSESNPNAFTGANLIVDGGMECVPSW